ncbi:HXXEE domain-containing protein [Streptomyces sp. NPDC046866]|uniref:HXXEE domain-containing protein n=1 Tax=Streptomyces sp. NPDC046866 TaxID=3154921 RepID=UPI0034522319
MITTTKDAAAGAGAAGAAATLGLLAAWAVHDTEEALTVGRWSRERVPVLRARHPRVPERIWQGLGSVNGRQFTAAAAVVALVVGAAAADGYRTGGRSAFYQASLNAFGLHGLVHLGQAAATRGYTPGVATSPLLVVPFTLWARGRLRRAGVLRPTRPRDAAVGLAVAAATAAAGHTVARRLLGHRP